MVQTLYPQRLWEGTPKTLVECPKDFGVVTIVPCGSILCTIDEQGLYHTAVA